MQDYQFNVIFIPQKEGGFTAEVLDLPGCISEGDTFEEAEKNIEEAIVLYLETLEERGVPLPERPPKKLCMTFHNLKWLSAGLKWVRTYARA